MFVGYVVWVEVNAHKHFQSQLSHGKLLANVYIERAVSLGFLSSPVLLFMIIGSELVVLYTHACI